MRNAVVITPQISSLVRHVSAGNVFQQGTWKAVFRKLKALSQIFARISPRPSSYMPVAGYAIREPYSRGSIHFRDKVFSSSVQIWLPVPVLGPRQGFERFVADCCCRAKTIIGNARIFRTVSCGSSQGFPQAEKNATFLLCEV